MVLPPLTFMMNSIMNMREGNTILCTSKLPKNYSNLPMYVCVVCKIHVPLQNAHSKKNARTNSKQIQSIPTKFEVKVSQGTQTTSEIQTKSPFHQFKLVFFFFWESSTSIDSPQTSYTHTSYPLLPSPFQFTRCVSVSHNHTPTFLNERWGWIRLWVTFALDVSRCSPKLSRPSSPFIQSPNKGLNLPFHVLCSTNKFWTTWLPSFFEWNNVNLRLVGLNCWGYYTK